MIAAPFEHDLRDRDQHLRDFASHVLEHTRLSPLLNTRSSSQVEARSHTAVALPNETSLTRYRTARRLGLRWRAPSANCSQVMEIWTTLASFAVGLVSR